MAAKLEQLFNAYRILCRMIDELPAHRIWDEEIRAQQDKILQEQQGLLIKIAEIRATSPEMALTKLGIWMLDLKNLGPELLPPASECLIDSVYDDFKTQLRAS